MLHSILKRELEQWLREFAEVELIIAHEKRVQLIEDLTYFQQRRNSIYVIGGRMELKSVFVALNLVLKLLSSFSRP